MVAHKVGKALERSAKKASANVKHHYWNIMPVKKRHRILIWSAFFGISAIMGWQIAYPPDRGLPLASVNGTMQSNRSYDEMAKAVVEKFDQTKIKLSVAGAKEVEFELKVTGAEPNTDVMITKMTDYPFWQRFIPGSILWQPVRVQDADIYFAGKPFDAFVAEQAKAFSFAAKNARIAIKDGQVVAEKEIAGSRVDAVALGQAISGARIALGGMTTITVPAQRIEPTETSADLEKVKNQVQDTLSHTITIKAEDKTFIPSRTDIAEWLILGTSDKGLTTLTIDREKVRLYANAINSIVGTPAGQTNVTIVDGRETNRTTGASGRSVDIDQLADQLVGVAAIEPKSVTVNAVFKDLPPTVVYNSRYSATQAGLQAYVEDTARTKNMHIMIQQLDGERWSAHARETESIPSGSTFKVYLAKILFDKIDAGEIHWGDPMLDTNVAGCFERMTVPSTNPCAESWIAQWGREYINNYIYGLGFSQGTSFTTGGAVQTTAADLNRYMTMLYNGTILVGANRDRLLDSLGRHPYRYGIPTGSAGVVHDKVGFLWDYVHDAAIVQHPRGTYIMTIMTKGQSYGAIASVTREVERIMFP
jgi:hypothetical protein